METFAIEMELNADAILSNRFRLEWPPRSGGLNDYPEVARAAWFSLADARRMILPSQALILDRLQSRLGRAGGDLEDA